MKKLIILLLALNLLSSCDDDNIAKYTCTKGTIRILNKNKYPCVKGIGFCMFQFYLYDGKKAYLCTTDEKTYDSYNINDTLPTLVITKQIIK